MAGRRLLHLGSWVAAATTILATDVQLGTDVVNAVQPCAQDCFRTFAAANFDVGSCGETPSLQCICTLTGKSGYTIGEGAVQCIVGQLRQGSCPSDSNLTAQVNTAFNMCVGVQNAAIATHRTIAATYTIPSSTVSISAASSTLVQSTTAVSSTTSSAIPVTTASITTTAAPAATLSPPSSSPVLSTAAVIGIAVGGAVVLLLGIVLILVARCLRKRRYGDQESGFHKMNESKSRAGSPNLTISNPTYKTPVEMAFRFNRPGDFSEVMVQKENIGLAISPGDVASAMPHSQPTSRTQQHMSPGRSLTDTRRSPVAPTVASPPPKPVLTLTIPLEAEPGKLLPAVPPAGAAHTHGRESVVTEFAEDGEVDSGSSSAQIWRPPPSDPQSATTYYVADKWGNWVLGHIDSPPPHQDPVELPSPADKTKAEKAHDAAKARKMAELAAGSSLEVPAPHYKTTPKLGSPIRFKDQGPLPRATSSVYSTLPAVPQVVKPGPQNPLPTVNVQSAEAYRVMLQEQSSTAGSAKAPGTSAAKPRRKSTRRARAQERRHSQDSVTTIEDDASDVDFNDAATQIDLSPVVESPRTPGALANVSYPYIPPKRWNVKQSPSRNILTAPTTLKLFPPSRAEIVNPANVSGSPLRKAEPVQARSPPVQSRSPPAIRPTPKGFPAGRMSLHPNPNPNRNPAQMRTGSPETRQGALPGAAVVGSRVAHEMEREKRQQTVPVPNPNTTPQNASLAQLRMNEAARSPPPPEAFSPRQQAQQQQVWRSSPAPMSPTQQRKPSAEDLRLMEGPPQAAGRPSPVPQPQQQQQARSSPTPHVADLVSSSLLAKRLGEDRAAALVLPGPDGAGRQPGGKWKRDTRGGAYEPHVLPSTPGWLPRLTPTRRGDDLFLNVQ